jgi:uncharacterized iron-regulated membrane protein
VRRWHRYIGLISIVPLVWFAVTGSVLGVAHLWRDSAPPYALPEAPFRSLTLESLDSILNLADAHTLRGIKVPPHAGLSSVLQLASGAKWFVDESSNRVIEKRDNADFDLVKTLTDLHRGKIMGTPGRIAFSILGLITVLLVLSGVKLLRWPRRSRRSTPWTIHQQTAFFTFIPLFVILLTGIIWNVAVDIRPLHVSSDDRVPSRVEWMRALEKSQSVDPEQTIHELVIVQGRFLAVFKDYSRLYLSLDSKETQLRRSWTMSGWYEPFFAFHSGKVLGSFGPIVPTVVGCFAMLLTVTGVQIYFRTRRRSSLRKNVAL